MSNIFFISDQHYGHENILKFTGSDGKRIRPMFSSAEEMDEHMIERHNSVVGDQDIVWFGGDIAFTRTSLDRVLPRLKGRKNLVLGNHDKLDMSAYIRYFKKIRVIAKFDQTRGAPFKCILSHYPMRSESFEFRDNGVKNIHGHIHQNKIVVADNKMMDTRYINVCVEAINYTPVEISLLGK